MLKRADHEISRQSTLFSSLPEDLADMLLDRAATHSYDRGATIFLQGDPAALVHIVLEGWVKLFRISPNGAEAVVGIFTKGQSFAEAAAFRSDVYPVTAEAVTDCRLLQVRSSLILEMMKSRPELCTAILASTFHHLHELVSQIEQLKAHTGAQRVAEFLLEHCPVDEGACAVTLPYDKILIAGRLGMKPESLSRAFARLRGTGVMVKQNHAAIADVEKLRDYVEEDRAIAWSKAQ
jgi:CRP/FNR family transcriptional regulator, dissimilatory nitrate respiration regulator